MRTTLMDITAQPRGVRLCLTAAAATFATFLLLRATGIEIPWPGLPAFGGGDNPSVFADPVRPGSVSPVSAARQASATLREHAAARLQRREPSTGSRTGEARRSASSPRRSETRPTTPERTESRPTQPRSPEAPVQPGSEPVQSGAATTSSPPPPLLPESPEVELPSVELPAVELPDVPDLPAPPLPPEPLPAPTLPTLP